VWTLSLCKHVQQHVSIHKFVLHAAELSIASAMRVFTRLILIVNKNIEQIEIRHGQRE